MIVGLVSQLYFFIKATIGLTINLDGTVGLAINRAILMRIDISIGFFELSL